MRASTFLLLLTLALAISGCVQKAEVPPEVQVAQGEEGISPRNKDLRSFYVYSDILRDNSTGTRMGLRVWIIPKEMGGEVLPVSGTLELTLYNLRELRALEPGVKEYVKGAAVFQRRIRVAPSYQEIVVGIRWDEVSEYSLSRPSFGVLRMEFRGEDGTELRQDYGDMYGVTSDLVWLRDPGYAESVEEGRFAGLKRYYHLLAYQFTKLIYGEGYPGAGANVTATEQIPADVEARLKEVLAALKEAQAYADNGNTSLALSGYSGAGAELERLLEEPGLSERARSNLRHLSGFAGRERAAFEKEMEAEGMLLQINASRKRCSEELECDQYRALMTAYNSLRNEASGELALAREELGAIVGWEHLDLPGR